MDTFFLFYGLAVLAGVGFASGVVVIFWLNDILARARRWLFFRDLKKRVSTSCTTP